MNILYFYSDNSTKLDSMPRAVAAESGLVAIACINHVSIYIYISPILWYSGFYDSMYSHANSINFCYIFLI